MRRPLRIGFCVERANIHHFKHDRKKKDMCRKNAVWGTNLARIPVTAAVLETPYTHLGTRTAHRTRKLTQALFRNRHRPMVRVATSTYCLALESSITQICTRRTRTWAESKRQPSNGRAVSTSAHGSTRPWPWVLVYAQNLRSRALHPHRTTAG